MRKGTHHTPETRLAIRLKRLEKSMPADEFARFMASDGILKWCPACKQLLPVGDYQKNRRSWDGLYSRCRDCNALLANAWHRERSQDDEYRERKNKRQREWRAANRGEKPRRANRAYHLKQFYGITMAEFEAMHAAQHGCCAICKTRFKSDRDSQVDHDHACCPGKYTCGKCLRGLLCGKCNVALGGFRDDPAILRQAVTYLVRAAS